MPILSVTTLDDERLEPYRGLPGRRNERQTGIFITEGDKVTRRMVAAGWDVVSLLVEPQYADEFAAKLPPETPIYVASRELLTETVGFNFARGVLGCGRRPRRRLWRECFAADGRTLFVVLPDIQDPTNLATIIRTSAAFGATAVVVGPEAADVWSRRVVRVSMGAVFSIPIIECDSIGELLDQWRRDTAIKTVATVLDADATPLNDFATPDHMAVLIGNEGHGLPDELARQCDHRLTIAMSSGVDSLNASVAAGIFLHGLTRSRVNHP